MLKIMEAILSTWLQSCNRGRRPHELYIMLPCFDTF